MSNYPLLFVERLSEHDLELLATLDRAPGGIDELRLRLRERPEMIDDLLSIPQLYDRLFSSGETGVITRVTPQLAFGALVHKTMRDLGSASYVAEWVGAGERLPVFDVASLRDFIADVTRRCAVAEFLGSFTRVSSGSVWVHTERGYRRRRYSELDPVAMAEMVQSLPTSQRTAGYRRLGDVTLFLIGVFPDHTARHPMSAPHRARLARFAGVSTDEAVEGEYLDLLERVGKVWYQRAASSSNSLFSTDRPLQEMADNFTQARRFLNYLADSYLHSYDTGLMNPVT